VSIPREPPPASMLAYEVRLAGRAYEPSEPRWSRLYEYQSERKVRTVLPLIHQSPLSRSPHDEGVRSRTRHLDLHAAVVQWLDATERRDLPQSGAVGTHGEELRAVWVTT